MMEKDEVTVAFYGSVMVVGKRSGGNLLRPRMYTQSEEKVKDAAGNVVRAKNGEPITQVRMHLSPLPGIPLTMPFPHGIVAYSITRTEMNAAFYDLYQQVTQGQ